MVARIIEIDEKNIQKYGLFCKKSQKRQEGYQNKIHWIKERFKEGLKYKLLLVEERGKETSRGFIEYIPAEFNWRGIQADGWMAIHCLWVVGKHKNKGYASRLLNECVNDTKNANMHGIVAMSAEKGGWLPNRNIFLKNGFEKVDELKPYYELYAKFFSKQDLTPKFYPLSQEKLKRYRDGLTILYTEQCPYLPDLVKDLEKIATAEHVKFNSVLIKDYIEAQQNGIHPYGTFCIVCNGDVIPYKPGIKSEIIELLHQKD